jgi:hypothetical protein
LAERKTVPELGCSSPAINLSIVDLPIPFGPTTANIEDIILSTATWQGHFINLTTFSHMHRFNTSVPKDAT